MSELERLVAEQHLAAGVQQARERAQELALAVAGDAGDADDLAALSGHADIVEGAGGQVPDRELGAAGLRPRALRREHAGHGAADDEPQHLLIRHLADRSRAPDLAVAQHGRAVGDLADLLEPVRDVDHGGAARGRHANLLEQQLDQVGGERRGRLVEYQHLGIDRERLCEFDELALRDADFDHPHAGMNRAADALELGGDPIQVAAVAAAQVRRNGQQHVLGHRQVGQHRGVLVDDGEPQPLGLRGGQPFDCLAADFDRAGVGGHVTGGNPHQRGFAGSVLAQERMDLAGDGGERDILDGHHAAELFPDMGQAQSNRLRIGHRDQFWNSLDHGHLRCLLPCLFDANRTPRKGKCTRDRRIALPVPAVVIRRF